MSGATNSRAADTAPAGIDYVLLDELGRLAALASSYWRSVELAADRGDTLTVITHCKQVAAVTREAFAMVQALGEG